MSDNTQLLFAAAKIEEAVRYAKTKNTAYGHDETVLRDIKLFAQSLRDQAAAQSQENAE